MEWLQTITKLPILVKGVLTAEDGKNNTNNSNFDSHFYNFCECLNIFYFFCWFCSKAFSSGWSSRDYCVESRCSPTRLCPFHYYGAGRGNSTCFYLKHIYAKLIEKMIGVLKRDCILSLYRWCQVVKAAQGRVPVFLDGGVRRGTDVFKALALGASGIFVSIKPWHSHSFRLAILRKGLHNYDTPPIC